MSSRTGFLDITKTMLNRMSYLAQGKEPLYVPPPTITGTCKDFVEVLFLPLSAPIPLAQHSLEHWLLYFGETSVE